MPLCGSWLLAGHGRRAFLFCCPRHVPRPGSCNISSGILRHPPPYCKPRISVGHAGRFLPAKALDSRHLTGRARVRTLKVALQLQSLEGYCSSVGHILWDLHSSDVLINKRGDETKLIVMDAYMAPDETPSFELKGK